MLFTIASIPSDLSAAIIWDPLVVAPDAAVLDVIAQMSHLARRAPIQATERALAPSLRAHCAIVVNRQQVVGIFTAQDVVDLMAQQQPLQGVTLGQVMTHPVISLAAAAFTDLSVATHQLQHYQIHHLPIVDGQGALVGVVTYKSLHQAAIHQQHQAEQIARQQVETRLQESEQRYASLVAAAPVGIFRTDAKGNCVYVNERWSQIVGLPLAAALGEGWQQGLHPDDRDHVFMAWQQAAINQQPFQLEYRFQQRDGTVRWVKGQAVAEQDAQGRITGYVGTIADITESKQLEAKHQQSERALHQSQQQLLNVLDSAIAGIVRLRFYPDASIEYNYISPHCEQNFGYTAAALIADQKLWKSRIHPDDWDAVVMPVFRAVLRRRETSIQVMEYRFHRQDGSVRWILSKCFVEWQAAEQYWSITIVDTDISDRKQAELALATSEAHQRALISALPDLILRVNRAGIYLEFVTTPDFPLVGGWAEFVGTHVSESLPPQAASQRLAMIEQALQTSTTQIYEQDLSTQGNVQVEEVRVVPCSQDEVLLVMRDISDRKQAEAALQSLIQGTAATTGRDFFPALASHIAETLEVSYALVTEQVGSNLRTLGFWANDALQPTYTYGVAHTPCERVLQRGELYCDSSVQQRFPQDPDLVDMEAESYLGIALQGSSGKAIGHLCVLSQQPIADHQQATQILRVFAARAAAELERQRTTTALEQLNQALEDTVAERTLALQASEAQVRAMIGAIPDLLLRVKLDGTCLESIYPANSSDQFLLIQHHLSEALPPDLLQRQLDQIGHAIDTNQLQVYEHQFQKHHRQVHEEVRITPIGADEALIIVRDISDRKRLDAERQQAEMALRDSEERYRSIYEQTAVGLVNATLEGRFLQINPRFCEMLGYSREELLAKTVGEITHPDDAVQITPNMQQLFAGDIAYFFREKRYLRKDGSHFWSSTGVSMVRDATGNPVHILAVIRDITERKQVEAELNAKTNEIQQAYKELKETQLQLIQSEKMSSLGQLVAGIAHEINNPVSFIYGNLAVARNYTQDLKGVLALYQDHYAEPPRAIANCLKATDIAYVLEDFPKLLQSMENGAVRIRDIVASLRTFSRLDQSDLKATDIHENIDSTLVILQNRLNGRAGKPEIQVVKAYGDLPLIECYSGLLNQVFMNLLVNAIDAIDGQQANVDSDADSDYGGYITIETRVTSAEQVSISIRDNGIGMSAETQTHIFDPFFTTKPVGVGTGMGLSISYQIVTGNHQGQLSCHSVPGEGTEFSVELWQLIQPPTLQTGYQTSI